MDSEKKSVSINVVDKETHDSVLRLDQKLKGLLVEIEAKIEALSHETDQTLVSERRARLLTLSDEVKKALVNIKQLVSLVVGKDAIVDTLHPDDLDDLRQIVGDGLDKINHFKEVF